MSRRSSGGPDGIAVIDKAAGWTSHDVVAKSRGLLGTRKVGHSGTLDPDATGVLVLGVGRATRLLRFLQLLPKSYDATIQFGTATSTLDAAGEVVQRVDMTGLDPAAVLVAAKQFVGDILQVPPMVSALKVDGRRLHELAREGIEVERAARPVTIGRFDLTPTDDPLVWHASVDCSSGTYIRSLAADLGEALGGVAHLASLRRTAVGAFTLADARPLESVELLPLREAMRGFPEVTVDDELADRIRNGAVLDGDSLSATSGAGETPVGGASTDVATAAGVHRDPTPQTADQPVWVLTGSGEPLGVYERHRDGERWKPSVILGPTTH